MKLRNAMLMTVTLALYGAAASAADGDTRIATEFGGKPPFKRQIVSSEDHAAREAAGTTVRLAAGERLQVADVGSRPPFARRFVTAGAEGPIEFARFEEAAPRVNSGRRMGAPGKGFR